TYIREMTPILTGSNGKGSPVWVYNKVNGVKVYEEGGSLAYETGDFYLMRNAEAYLNAAEAAAYLGNNAEAAAKLKELRRHRVESDNADYGSDLVTLVREERARELLLEGHRWFDLRRYMVAPKPYSKQITHYYTDFNTGTSKNPQPFATTQYTLEENDPAYTLALPKEVTEFQNTLPSVVRPARPGRPYDQFADVDMAAAGQRDGTRAGEAAAKADSEAGNASQNSDRNPLYYDFYNGDYQQFKDYKDAYSQAFKEAYEANYVKKEVDPDEGGMPTRIFTTNPKPIG
ncbi:MAG: RagB/SusD family nutrient uptake outer membrane protein, partial [Odoribacter sp.]|nr:RagB/SusD family nutrient uptake outer membrane protein [Odoribacter sp.]